MNRIVFSICLLIGNLSLFAQSKIAGVVNSYYSVNFIDSTLQSAQLKSSSSLKAGDKVLLIQMKGATIDQSNTNNFGAITNYNSAGNYEILTICRVDNRMVYFSNPFLNSYNNNGNIQLIKIAEYPNGVELTGNLNAKNWNGNTGGVVIISTPKTIDLKNFNIDVSGAGFRGGTAVTSGGGCLFISSTTRYTDKNSLNDKAHKGEGIAEFIAGKECSRGPQANGGGGGNNHNGGGGGGANYGAGGIGGQRVKSTNFTCGSVTGLSANQLQFSLNGSRAYLGGGGGAGHGNNPGVSGEGGLNGGGIVILIANNIVGQTGSGILANGVSALANAENEGGGGGGAGGSIFLNIKKWNGPIAVNANGGNGSSVTNIGTGNCSGPGGAGGGGIIGFTNLFQPNGITVSAKGGQSGKIISSSQSNCTIGGRNGAGNGGTGAIKTSIALNNNSILKPTVTKKQLACNSFTSPSLKYTWITSGSYNDTLSNQAGCDSIINFNLTILPIDTAVLLNEQTLTANDKNLKYQWIDCDGKLPLPADTLASFSPQQNGNYALVVSNGQCSDTSNCYNITGVNLKNYFSKSELVSIFPNPFTASFKILYHLDQPAELEVLNPLGQVEQKQTICCKQELTILAKQQGIYLVRIKLNNAILHWKVTGF